MEQKILIDKRKYEDIVSEFNKLSKNYVPEWSFDRNKPDIGTTLGLIYSSQVFGNIESINQIIDRYHAEFINLLDISVNPAIPAKSIVIMNLVQDTIDGTLVNKGTRLLATNDGVGDTVVFETTDNVYITSAHIDNIFMTDREECSIVPIKGEIAVPSIIGESEIDEDEDVENTEEASIDILEEQPELNEIVQPFKLFGKMDGIGINAIVFYHSCIFDIEDNDIFVRLEGNDGLIADIVNDRKYFAYISEGAVKKVEEVSLLADGCTFCVRKKGKNQRQIINKKSYSALAIIDNNPVKEDVIISDVSFSASGDKKAPDFVGNDITEYDPKECEPFGEELSLYQEFFIGADDYFKKSDSVITVEFDLEYAKRYVSLTAEEKQEELKIIKKKPTTMVANTPSEVSIQKISVEYFNGIGWKKLKSDMDLSVIFSGDKSGHVSFSFVCPKEWEQSITGAYDGRQLRMQILRADNCYIRPSVHVYPQITNLNVSFSYDGNFMHPERIKSIAKTKVFDLQKALNKQEEIHVFRASEYDDDALYLGLSKRPVSGPVSIFVSLMEGVRYNPLSCVFEYSSIDGFKPLKVVDGTYNMTRSGLVLFLPPADFAAVNLEGNRKYYIRIRRKDEASEEKSDIHLPMIKNITLNGISVENVDTYPEQELYLDEITVGAKFNLPQSKILKCDVWVNETDVLTNQMKKEMLKTEGDRCRVEYDILGNITSFYVLWDEVERFEVADHARVYELDRLSSTLIFGNGIDTDIPRQTDAPAIIVKVRCCQGGLGNVDEYAINSSFGHILYVGDIYNPVMGYGGSDMESVDAALKRGSNIISNRRRLVSKNDYINEVLSFSDRIDKVRCLIGKNTNGEDDNNSIILCLLMKDFLEGSYSFHKVAGSLKEHIIKRCSMTIPANKLQIIEPVFVDISLTAWVRTEKMQDAFEIQSSLTDMMKQYLNPVSSISSKGWNIGVIPTASQIQMKVNSFRKVASIKNVAIVASYTDSDGYHEMDLNELKVTHNMVCRSGNHKIHVDA